MVELKFHPSLSRAANFDDEPDNDGIYLLLQPLNELGQMVPVAAALSVVILDPARDERIGRWDFSPEEVKTKLQPIGANQGIALTLPWSGPGPEADRVIVFVRYTFENGRTVVNDTEILVSNDEGLQAVWAPRSPAMSPTEVAASSTAEQQFAPAVIPASHADVKQNSGQPGAKVVRPASGTTSPQPAPSPSTTSSSPWSAR